MGVSFVRSFARGASYPPFQMHETHEVLHLTFSFHGCNGTPPLPSVLLGGGWYIAKGGSMLSLNSNYGTEQHQTWSFTTNTLYDTGHTKYRQGKKTFSFTRGKKAINTTEKEK